MRLEPDDNEEVEVAMSPLIDCVFLLLIFFLVTTMLKKLEKQIPVTLPDSTSALAQVPNIEEVIIGLDDEGRYFRATADRDREGSLTYRRIDDFALFLKELAQERGTEVPIRIDADRDTGFQKVIDGLDICQIQGFGNVGVRLKIDGKEYFTMPGVSNRREDVP